MTMTIAEARPLSESAVLPEERLLFKTATTPDMGAQTVDIDEERGVVTAIVSVTGVVDEVDDIIVPGAYAETLAKRNPKVCWAHSWEHPIGRVLKIEELMPGDKRLPAQTRDGKPWPREAGALVAEMQFNLRTSEGKDAFEVVRFYSETGECEYSIGYNVPPGKASNNSRGTRLIKMLELYELSVVLFGAHTMTGTLSIKDAQRAIEAKRVGAAIATKGRDAVDFGALRVESKVGDEGRPPPFEKREDAEPGETEGEECTCCGGGGEHTCGHECYVCDASGQRTEQALASAGLEPGDPIVCQGHHGRSADGEENPPEGGHDPDPVSPDSAPDDTPVLGGGETDDDDPEGEDRDDEDRDDDEDPDEQGDEPATETGATGTESTSLGNEQATNNTPDFSDGIMVAIYPDAGAAQAIANHLVGPDNTTPREELHVTLAYLGKVGSDAPSEQALVDAVMRAVEGQPALRGEIGGIGMFPAGDEGTPTYAPVDIPGLSLLREHIVAALGDAVYNNHGFTPHMTLGYDIGLIQPVPPTPIEVTSVRIVYGNTRRDITLGAPVPEAKGGRTYFTEAGAPEGADVTDGDVWFETSTATLHTRDASQWKVATVSTTDIAAIESPPLATGFYDPALDAKGYDPALDVKAGQPRVLPGLSADLMAAMQAEEKAGGADRNRGGAARLRRYWTIGEGGLKIGWNTPGDFRRCVVLLSEHMLPERAKGYCANRHKEMTGVWPGDSRNKDAGDDTQTKATSPGGVKAYPYMDGSYEHRRGAVQDAIAAQYADEVDEHGHPQVYIDLRATWPDRALYTVSRFGPVDASEHYLATYDLHDDGTVDLGDINEVELSIVPIPREDGDEDEFLVGDTLPLAETILSVASSMKMAQRGVEGKAGRVLSGANERALRAAFEHLVAVATSAGIDLGQGGTEDPIPLANTSAGTGDERREIDPAVDLSTTSPEASRKSAEATEQKDARGGEILMIDMAEHRRILDEINRAAEGN